MSRTALCSGLLCALLLAACGATSHSSTAGTTASATTATSATATSTTSIVTQSPAFSTTALSTATHSKTTATLTRTSTPVAPPPVAGPRVPATYKILPSGVLSPPSISVPVGYRVELTFLARGVAASVLVLTPHRVRLNVPGGGEASKVIGGVPKGTYPIVIGGSARGSLVIGSAPGP